MKRRSWTTKSGYRLVAASVVLAAVAATGSTAPATADTPSTVSGTVSRADGGSPEGIVVATWCDDDDSGRQSYTSASTTAAADGSYSLPIPPGYVGCPSLLVTFHDPTGTYVPQFFGNAFADYEATGVEIAPGDTTLEPETLSWVAGAIRGQVFNTYGRPVRDRDIQVRANSGIYEDSIPAFPVGVGPEGGFVLRGLMPIPASASQRYAVETYSSARYADVTTSWTPKRLIAVTAGKATTIPRLIVKDRPRVQFRTTWHAHSATIRIRVSSRATGRAAVGTVAAFVGSEKGDGGRQHIRLRHGRATVTLRAAFPREQAKVYVGYQGSRHVAAADRQRKYSF